MLETCLHLTLFGDFSIKIYLSERPSPKHGHDLRRHTADASVCMKWWLNFWIPSRLYIYILSFKSALSQPDLAWFPILLFFTHKLDLHPRTKYQYFCFFTQFSFIVNLLPNKIKQNCLLCHNCRFVKTVNKGHCTALKYYTIEYL